MFSWELHSTYNLYCVFVATICNLYLKYGNFVSVYIFIEVDGSNFPFAILDFFFLSSRIEYPSSRKRVHVNYF